MNYVQYGCGLSAPAQWKNFDVSPTLRIQKTPIIGSLIKKKLNTIFPDNVNYGCIIKGLPIKENSADGLYCSHTLEHLALDEFRIALKNSYKVLKPGSYFRCIVPDIEFMARSYVKDLEQGDKLAAVKFIESTLMGVPKRPRGLKGLITSFFGNSHHLWMWDYASLSSELANVGFKNIRRAEYNDSKDPMFKHVEDPDRFINAVAIECQK